MRKLNEKEKAAQTDPADAAAGDTQEKEAASTQGEAASDDKQADENGEGAEEAPEQETEETSPEPDEKQEEQPEEVPSADVSANDDTETSRLKDDLLLARSQIAAYSAGVASEMVADAVTLAMAEARAAGEVTEDAVAKAMANVLKRHPEWKAQSAAGGKKASGGFKLGVDPDRSPARDGKKSDTGQKKPWNKFNH